MLNNDNQIQVRINVSDVNYAIEKLSSYDEPYSKGVMNVFQNYLMHQDFFKMREELETVPQSTAPLWKQWDVNANIGFLEVIYPTDVKGGTDNA